jgi:hypothetical protein
VCTVGSSNHTVLAGSSWRSLQANTEQCRLLPKDVIVNFDVVDGRIVHVEIIV